MPRHYSALARAALTVAALTMLPILIAAKPVPVWDEANIPIPCGGQQVVTFTPATHQSAIARYDDATMKVVTVVVFLDAQNLEQDGHALRHHFSTATARLFYEVHSSDVTVKAETPPCMTGPGNIIPGSPRVAPTPVPPVWQHDLVVPCGADPELPYNRSFGFSITWVGPAQDKLIFDAWKDSGHVAAAGRDERTTVTTNHAFAGCKLYWTDNAPVGRYSVSFFARLPNTSAPAFHKGE